MKTRFLSLFIIIILFVKLSINNYNSETTNNFEKEFQIQENNNIEPTIDNVEELITNAPNSFIENHGQIENDAIRFYAQGGAIWFTDDAVWFEIREELSIKSPESRVMNRESDEWFDPMEDFREPEPVEYKCVILKQAFIGANNVRPEGRYKLSWNCNFFYGNDSSKWYTNVPNFGELYYENLYNGIDLRYYDNGNGLKYDLIVHPAADPAQIKIRWEGAEELIINKNGDLIIKTEVRSITDSNLFIYQDLSDSLHQIDGRFHTYENNEYGFDIIGEYSESHELIIDPFLEYSTYVGGSNFDLGYGIAVDSNGNAYVTGYTYSSNFPTTPGANDSSQNGLNDVFIIKMNPSGSKLLYSTFIGGSNWDEGYDISVDLNGYTFVTGMTWSSNFPTTPGANDTSHNGAIDCFVLKLNQTGSNLIYSTFIGGNSDDNGQGIAIDSIGNAFVTGYTKSSNFPTTSGANDTSFNEGGDIIIFKLDKIGSMLIYSTYIGGSDGDLGYDISIDDNGNAFVTGRTDSSDFPTTGGANDTSHNGGADVFVLKLNQTGSLLNYSTFIGGSNWDYGNAIVVDSIGNAFVTGITLSSNFPTTVGAYDTTYNTGTVDIFIFKLNQTGTELNYSTYIGGNSHDFSQGLAIDSGGNAFITGYTDSTNFPITIDAYDKFLNKTESYLLKLASNGSMLLYSTFIGGNSNDYARNIVIDSIGNLYITGNTTSLDFPTTSSANSTKNNGADDIFVFKFSFSPTFKITSLSLIEGNKPTSVIYSRYYPYTFRVKVIDTISLSDLNIVRLYLDPTGTNILLHWDRASGLFTKFFDLNNYITLESSSNAYNNSLYEWTIDFNVTYNWNYLNEDFLDVQTFANNATLSTSWINFT